MPSSRARPRAGPARAERGPAGPVQLDSRLLRRAAQPARTRARTGLHPRVRRVDGGAGAEAARRDRAARHTEHGRRRPRHLPDRPGDERRRALPRPRLDRGSRAGAHPADRGAARRRRQHPAPAARDRAARDGDRARGDHRARALGRPDRAPTARRDGQDGRGDRRRRSLPARRSPRTSAPRSAGSGSPSTGCSRTSRPRSPSATARCGRSKRPRASCAASSPTPRTSCGRRSPPSAPTPSSSPAVRPAGPTTSSGR